MIETCETVIVKTADGEVRVNKEDAHLYVPKKKAQSKKAVK